MEITLAYLQSEFKGINHKLDEHTEIQSRIKTDLALLHMTHESHHQRLMVVEKNLKPVTKSTLVKLTFREKLKDISIFLGPFSMLLTMLLAAKLTFF